MADTSTTTKLPKEVYDARASVVDALNVKYSKAHYLEQLSKDEACTFVQSFDNSEALQKYAQTLGYSRLDAVIHQTETWTRLLLKPPSASELKMLGKMGSKLPSNKNSQNTCTLEDGLKFNPKKVLLSLNKISVPAVAHELIHWLSHPNWGKVFEPITWANEGAAEGLMRFAFDGKYRNGVYDNEVEKVMKLFESRTLLPAYFSGDVESLKILVKASEDQGAEKRLGSL
jgi:hypothetical protein